MMHLNVTKKIGKNKYSFTFMGENLFEAVMESQHLGFADVDQCGLCESDELELRAYQTKEDKYEYVKISCRKCRATLTLGKTKKEGAFFFRRNEDGSLAWDAYKPKKNTQTSSQEDEQ
jgi:hypothetical protein